MEISSINKPRQEEQGHSHQAPDKEDKENFKDNKNFRQNFKMKPTTSAILILTILGFSASIQAFHVEVNWSLVCKNLTTIFVQQMLKWFDLFILAES